MSFGGLAFALALLALLLAAVTAAALVWLRRPLDLAAVFAALLASLVLALLLIGAADAGQALAAGGLLLLFLLFAANQRALEGLPERLPWPWLAAALLSLVCLVVLLLRAGPAPPEPLGAYLSRRALSEFGQGANPVHAALLSFRLAWSVPAAAALAIAGGAVWSLLRYDRPTRPKSDAGRSAP